MLTGDNGILTQAQEAKKQTSIAEEKEQIALAYNAAVAKKQSTDITAKELDDELKANEAGANAIEDGENIKVSFTETGREYTIDGNGTITEGGTTPTPPEDDDNEATVGEIVQPGEGNKDYTNGGYTAKIPEGFMIVPGLDNIEEGLVISDDPDDTEVESSSIVAEGNQFVWVPVPVFTEFKRYDFKNNTEVSSSYVEESADGTANSTEVEKMYKSVNDNKGFYIGRYEAGSETERTKGATIADEVLSKKNKFVYNYIGWNNDGTMTTETGGAVEKARSFSTQSGHTNVTSTLVYGVQWDAVMRWISEDENLAGYLTESTGKGNYSDDDDTNNPAKTGVKGEYQLKNIYDIAGNVSEWTMEAYSTDIRVSRGGGHFDSGSSFPVSGRGHLSPGHTGSGVGFRLAFFV